MFGMHLINKLHPKLFEKNEWEFFTGLLLFVYSVHSRCCSWLGSLVNLADVGQATGGLGSPVAQGVFVCTL